MLIKYRAFSKNNEVDKGIIEVNDIDDLRILLKNRGLELIKYKEIRPKRKLFYRKLSLIELSNFSNKLSLLLKTGLSLDKSLFVIKTTIKNNELKDSIDVMIEKLNLGISFSTILREYDYLFPELFISLIKVSEKVGRLGETLDYLSLYYHKEYKLKQKLNSSMVYPMILGCMTVIIFFVLILFVIPKFESIFYSMNIQEIPLITQYIFKISKFVKKYYIYLIMGILIFYIIIRLVLMKKNSMLKDWLKVNFPIIKKINMIIIVSRFARSMSLLYSNGVPIFQAYNDSVKIINNKYLKKKMHIASEHMKRGVSITNSLRKVRIFPNLMVELLDIGEQTNSLSEILNKISDHYEHETDSLLTKITQLIEPLIIVLIALVICIVVISIFLPMFGIMNQITEV